MDCAIICDQVNVNAHEETITRKTMPLVLHSTFPEENIYHRIKEGELHRAAMGNRDRVKVKDTDIPVNISGNDAVQRFHRESSCASIAELFQWVANRAGCIERALGITAKETMQFAATVLHPK